MMRKIKSQSFAALPGDCGQAAVEMALLVPLLLLILFGTFELGRVFYTYHTLQKALRGGAGVLAHTSNVNYCDLEGDPTIIGVKNMIVFGNLQQEAGESILPGADPQLLLNLITITPERTATGSTTVDQCLCSSDTDSCDPTSGGRAPDFVVVSLGPAGFPMNMALASVNFGTFSLKVSVRMPVTAG